MEKPINPNLKIFKIKFQPNPQKNQFEKLGLVGLVGWIETVQTADALQWIKTYLKKAINRWKKEVGEEKKTLVASSRSRPFCFLLQCFLLSLSLSLQYFCFPHTTPHHTNYVYSSLFSLSTIPSQNSLFFFILMVVVVVVIG